MKYTTLGGSGLKVSKICVGCMSYGVKKGPWTWTVEEAEALPILQACYEKGINFYDTANGYSNGASEIILGKAIRKYNWRRSSIVVATKVWMPVGLTGVKEGEQWDDTLSMTDDQKDQNGHLNGYGLSRKRIFEAVEESLQRLQLDYIDLYQIHRFDYNTPVKETMKALHDLVESGKVRYIGASSMYAHQFLEMQYTARIHGWTEFISMQNLHNATYREEEREMVPALKKFGCTMIPWSPLAMGFLARPHKKVAETTRGDSKDGNFINKEYTREDLRINEEVEKIAKERGTSMAVVATAWSLGKGFVTAPILGMSKVERVEEACRALEFELNEEETARIDGLYVPKSVAWFG